MEIKQVRHSAKAPVLKKVCAYARVSTGKDAMLHSLAAQVDYYSTLIRHTPGWEYVGVYADEAISGTRTARPEFERMMEDCRAGKVDMIITKSISRFARNTLALLDAARELKSFNCDIYFEEQNIHTISDEGELMLTLLASFAQEESRSVSENMKWRIRKRFESGIPWNGTVLGYRLVDGTFQVVPKEAGLVRKIFSLYLEGYSAEKIADKLNAERIRTRFGNEWYFTSVLHILRNRLYIGELLLQQTIRPDYMTKKHRPNNGQLKRFLVTDAHEAIIDTETFNAVQEEFKRRTENYSKNSSATSHAFSGKIVCGLCGENFRHKNSGGKSNWVCRTYNTKGKSACPSDNIPDYVLQEMADEIGGIDNIHHITAYPHHRIILHLSNGTIEERIWKHKSRKDSWTDEMKEKARKREIIRRNAQCRRKEM